MRMSIAARERRADTGVCSSAGERRNTGSLVVPSFVIPPRYRVKGHMRGASGTVQRPRELHTGQHFSATHVQAPQVGSPESVGVEAPMS